MTPAIGRGFTLIETLAAILVASLLTLAVLSTFIAQHRALVTTSLRAEIEGAFDLTGLVVTSEIRAGVQGRDWQSFAGDSIRLRAFRGSAKVCGSVGALLHVEASGDRSIDPSKDSVLVLDPRGVWQARDVLWARSGQRRCAPLAGSAPETWLLDVPVPGAVVARFFERGTYSMGGGALRYRRGRSGRQPLTSAVLDSAQSGISSLGGGGIEFRLIGAPLHAAVLPRSWTFRAWAQGGAP